jgi:hypothetical protein
VTENWNEIPNHVKNVKTVSGFLEKLQKSQRAGEVEHNTRKTLPEFMTK